jgi:hypothetical protein
VTYPTLEQVEKASVDDIIRWNRFLPSPTTPEEVNTIRVIFARFGDNQRANPAEHSAASKRVGWGR